VYGDAQVYGNARVYGNAWVYGDAQVYGNARVYGDARVYGKLKLIAGLFFSFRYQKEEIKYIPVGDDCKLIYKGDAKFGQDEPEQSDDEKAAIELLKKNGYKIVKSDNSK
jgi:hypothetical protein